MTYPRHPRLILKAIREGLPNKPSQRQLGRQLAEKHPSVWSESTWENLEKGNQSLNPHQLSSLLGLGLINEGSRIHLELGDWLSLAEEAEELAKDEKYKDIRTLILDIPNCFSNKAEFEAGKEAELTQVLSGQVRPQPPPKEPEESEEEITLTEEETAPRPFKIDENRLAGIEPPPPKPAVTKSPSSTNYWPYLILGVGIIAVIVLLVSLTERLRQTAEDNRLAAQEVATPAPTQTPYVLEVTATPDSQPVVQPSGGGLIAVNLHKDLPEEYRETVFSNASSIWVREGVRLTGKNNPWSGVLGVWEGGTYHLKEADPASDAIGYVEVECPSGLPDREVVVKLWENNPQEDERFGYGWEFRIFADGSYEFIAP